MERARRRIDRSVAAMAVVVLGGCLIGVTAFARAPVPDAVRRDPQAGRELIARLQAGEGVTYVGEYELTRIRADGARLPAMEYEGHDGRVSFLRSGSALTIDTPRARYECEVLDTPGCFKRAAVQALPPSEVVRVVVDSGDYDVTRRPDATIAGERASCFVITARNITRQLPDLGPQAEMCLARDGVPLRNRRIDAGVRDEREAQHIVRGWDAAALAPAFGGIERAESLLAG